MTNISHRRDYLRQILQKADSFLSTKELHQTLLRWVEQDRDDLKHHKKTTLRDLKVLEEGGYVESRHDPDDERVLFWRATGRSHSLTMSPANAMTLTAIFQHAERFGLQSSTDELKGLRNFAELVMQDRAKRNLDFGKRITSGTRFTVLLPGKVDPEHLKRLQLAILDNTPLEIGYLPRDAGGVECTYQLKPLALSHQDSNIYLSAYVLEEEWPEGSEPTPDSKRGKYSSNGPKSMCALMLHRMTRVEPGKRLIDDPENYDVHSHAAQKDLVTIHTTAPQPIKLRLSANLHNRLSENPLEKDQTLVPDGENWILACKLHDTQGLRLFLMSNAADIEVLEPPGLRAHIRHTLETARAFYANDQG
jgi:predicted DNA-binding transcriptional regulator YafY